MKTTLRKTIRVSPLAVGLAFLPVQSSFAAPGDGASTSEPARASKPIPWSEIGTRATAQYAGDGLSISAVEGGAVLRCVLQRMNARATAEGLWITSTVDGANGEPFRVMAVAVGREGGSERGQPCPREPQPRDLRTRLSALRALPATGMVEVGEKLARFLRPGLVEEYSVSMDGVRQDFVISEKPNGSGELRLELDVSGAKVEPAAFGARLVLENSGRKIAYSRLRVSDATGKELPARMEVLQSNSEMRNQKSELAVVVNDGEAVYPVHIDPTFSDANWISMGGIAGAGGGVAAAVVDGGGNLYIAGSFIAVAETIVNYIAKWNGSSWSALGAGMNSTVYALAVSGNNLYAGGGFTTAGGTAANSIAKWNGSSWSALGSGIGGSVSALAVSGTDL